MWPWISYQSEKLDARGDRWWGHADGSHQLGSTELSVALLTHVAPMPTLFCPNSKVSLGRVTVGLLLLFGQRTHAGCHIYAPEMILQVQPPLISLFLKWCSCLAQSWSSSWALIPKSEAFISVHLWNFLFLFFFFKLISIPYPFWELRHLP